MLDEINSRLTGLSHQPGTLLAGQLAIKTEQRQIVLACDAENKCIGETQLGIAKQVQRGIEAIAVFQLKGLIVL